MRIIVNYKPDFYHRRLKDGNIKALVAIFLVAAIVLSVWYLRDERNMQTAETLTKAIVTIERRLPEAQYGRWSNGGGRHGGINVSEFYRIRFRIEDEIYDLWSYAYDGDLKELYEKLQSLTEVWAKISYLESGNTKEILQLELYGETLMDMDYAVRGLLWHEKMQNTIKRDMAIFCAVMLFFFLAVVQIETKKGKRYP